MSEFKKIGMLGVGSMGGMMTLLFAEHDIEVNFYDPSDENMKQMEQMAKDTNLQSKIHARHSYEEVTSSLDTPRLFVFSLPHGTVGDKVVDALRPRLARGDIILDCSNEHFAHTARRQAALGPDGIHYVGCGVSGGYQSARAGPSFSPGGSPEALGRVLPLLRRLAARDRHGRPCAVPVGPGPAGHYVKMVHNGIEQGMMAALAETWSLLTRGLGLPPARVADLFEAWDRGPGVLRDCFLVRIGADVNRQADGAGALVLASVRDKVVQDVDGSEGTGTWTCTEAVEAHVPAASILAAHLFRCASADLAKRIRARDAAGGNRGSSGGVDVGVGVVGPRRMAMDDVDEFVEALYRTTYFSFLTAFVQGMNLIRAKDRLEGWNLDYAALMQLWRGGCIIQADHIVGLLASVYERQDHDAEDVLANREIATELASNFAATKKVVLKALEADHIVPTISQSLEWFKYSTNTDLPTQFMEAELDYFGYHMYDRKDDPVGEPKTGKHHFEWKPAKGLADERNGDR